MHSFKPIGFLQYFDDSVNPLSDSIGILKLGFSLKYTIWPGFRIFTSKILDTPLDRQYESKLVSILISDVLLRVVPILYFKLSKVSLQFTATRNFIA